MRGFLIQTEPHALAPWCGPMKGNMMNTAATEVENEEHWGITCSECLDSDCAKNPELQDYCPDECCNAAIDEGDDGAGCTGYACV